MGRGWDGSDVGRTSSFMGELLSAVSTRPSLVGGHRVCGHSLFVHGGSSSSMGGGSHCPGCPGALLCSCWWSWLLASYSSLMSLGWGSMCSCWWLRWSSGGCRGHLVVVIVMLMVVVVVVMLVVVVIMLVVVVVVVLVVVVVVVVIVVMVVVVVIVVVVMLIIIGVVLVVVVVMGVVVVVMLVVVVAVLVLWPACCCALPVMWHCYVIVAVVSVYGVGHGLLLMVESSGGHGLWC